MPSTPEFITADLAAIVAEMVAQYEAATGRTLQPAQPERLLIDCWAYREYLMRQAFQDAALQNLVAFARFPALHFLGELVGVRQLEAKPATATFVVTLQPDHLGVVIPAGTRIASKDSKVTFEPTADLAVSAGVTSIPFTGTCTTAGTIGNGYLAGQIDGILDPIAGVVSIVNSTTSAGGGGRGNRRTDAGADSPGPGLVQRGRTWRRLRLLGPDGIARDHRRQGDQHRPWGGQRLPADGLWGAVHRSARCGHCCPERR